MWNPSKQKADKDEAMAHAAAARCGYKPEEVDWGVDGDRHNLWWDGTLSEKATGRTICPIEKQPYEYISEDWDETTKQYYVRNSNIKSFTRTNS